MTAIVQLHHNEPMTTSLAIADGVQLQHKNVIELIRKYVEDLNEFGRVAFETRPFDTDGGKQWRDIAFLNEQQSTFLLTLMRNSEIVVAFKKAMVKAFFELRDRATALSAPISDTGAVYPAHEADKIVASDRVFRAAHRAARASGLGVDSAYESARAIALRVSGVDLAGMVMEISKKTNPPLKNAQEGAAIFFSAAEAGEIEGVDLFESDRDDVRHIYRRWCEKNNFHVGDLDWLWKNLWYRRWKAEKEICQ